MPSVVLTVPFFMFLPTAGLRMAVMACVWTRLGIIALGFGAAFWC
jgi:hypothetical protein